ncbi:MAG: alpha/beta hydrolase, partial [Chloroflexi bacterium]|nr:alpha/beta hydrolase [Chloroflexota bacterium]
MQLDDAVQVSLGAVMLDADLTLPAEGSGIVVFAHGSGSSRHSPRNRQVAEVLHRGGLGTLLADLLTAEEEERDLETRELRFDISLLAGRVIGLLDWLVEQPSTAKHP